MFPYTKGVLTRLSSVRFLAARRHCQVHETFNVNELWKTNCYISFNCTLTESHVRFENNEKPPAFRRLRVHFGFDKFLCERKTSTIPMSTFWQSRNDGWNRLIVNELPHSDDAQAAVFERIGGSVGNQPSKSSCNTATNRHVRIGLIRSKRRTCLTMTLRLQSETFNYWKQHSW